MEAVIVGAGIYAYKKHKEHKRERRSRDSEPVTHVIENHYAAACVTSNVVVQQQYAAGAYQGEAVETVQDSKTLQYLRQATLKQLLAMLVDGVYSRDRERMDIPLIEAAYKEDVGTEMYTKLYWTRMQGISEEEEKKVGLQHYLRREPDSLANGCHNRYRLVIALRGTKLSSLRDLLDDIKVAHHTLHCSKRYKATQLLIEKIIALFRSHYDGLASEICITGHSLGAAIALSIGRDLAKDTSKRYAVHCFNPPYLTVFMLMEKLSAYGSFKNFLKRCKLLEPFLHTGSIAKLLGMLAVATIVFNDSSKLREEFSHVCSLIDWNPVFYVNNGDMICKEYKRFYEWKNRCFLQSGVPIQMQNLVARIVNRNAKYTSFVPSVDMFISKSDSSCHRLKQWYTNPTLVVEHQEFRLLPDANSSRYILERILDSMIKSISSLLPSIRSLPCEEYPAVMSSISVQTTTQTLPSEDYPAMINSFLSVQTTTCSLPPEGYPPMTNSLAPQPVMAYPGMNTVYPPQVPMGYPAMNTAYPPQVPMGYPAMNTAYPPQVPMGYPADCNAQSKYTGFEKELFDEDAEDYDRLDDEILPGSAEAVVLD